MYIESCIRPFFLFSVRGNFLLFTLSGWSKRALIARGSQGVFSKGIATFSLSRHQRRLYAENEPPNVWKWRALGARQFRCNPLLSTL